MAGISFDFKILAVDFDGTLCYSDWPDLGAPNEALITYLRQWRAGGGKLILWTCRTGELLAQAVAWCHGYHLDFDAVNDNLTEVVAAYGSNSRKITCDYYIDDKSLSPDLFVKISA